MSRAKNWGRSHSLEGGWGRVCTLATTGSPGLGGIPQAADGKRSRGWQGMRWFGSITDSMDMNLGKLREVVEDRRAWRATVHEVAKSRTRLSNNNKRHPPTPAQVPGPALSPLRHPSLPPPGGSRGCSRPLEGPEGTQAGEEGGLWVYR